MRSRTLDGSLVGQWRQPACQAEEGLWSGVVFVGFFAGCTLGEQVEKEKHLKVWSW